MSRDEGYAASMIRRFREAKPASRAERETTRDEVHQMWWVDGGGKQVEGNKRFELSSSSEIEIPRSSQPAPGRQSAGYEDVLAEIRQSEKLSRPATHNSTIDDMIAREIQELEREINSDPRRSLAGSIDVNIRSSYDEYEYGERRPTAERGQGPRDPLQDMRFSGDFLRGSTDTLGSTGFKALLYPEMKLVLNRHFVRHLSFLCL